MVDSKKIKILLAIVIFLFLLSGALAAIWLNNQFNKPKTNLKSETNYGDDIKLSQKAQSEKNLSYCDQLKSLKKDDCIYYAAINNNELAFCNLISDTAQAKKCSEIVAAVQIITDKDSQKCLSLAVEEVKADCLTEIFRQQNDLKYCVAFKNEVKVLCEDIVYTNLAFTAKDPTICDKIQSADNKINCQTAIDALPLDSDKDGVPDYLERSYGTNPFDPQSK
ncbi:MAG: thrombospondin type 3 repeat-containing protein [Candidatus Parcubacteria bacterium]|nr:thrombospondin type 3 repeat-containing protein [Candidatus Parcubacteria bacterium]